MGDKIRIDARVQDLETGNIIMGQKVVGEDPFTLVDSLTQKIAMSLNVTTTKGENRSVSTFMSSSPEAYKHYQLGLKKMLNELFDDAIVEYRKAIEIDSSFALPYMRIGMSYIFNSRQTDGERYLRLAKERESGLPVREQSLLDVYADIWLEQNFNSAFVKMASFVNKYPDDKEGHSIYGLLVDTFSKDTVKAFAHLDTALAIDPTFQFALSFYAQIYSQRNQYENALKYAEKIREYHPESPQAYLTLGLLYSRLGRNDDAIAEYELLLDRYPDNSSAMLRLSNHYILKKEFDKADKQIEAFKSYYNDDSYEMISYYYQKANLALWRGELSKGTDYRIKAYKEALKTGDSAQIANSLNTVSTYYSRMGIKDSALYYLKESNKYRTGFNKINYPLEFVSIAPERAEEIRKVFNESLDEFRARIPSDMWSLIDNVEKLFNAEASYDTSGMIEAFIDMKKTQTQDSNNRALGRLYTLTGEYEKGKELLISFIGGENESSTAYNYITSHYYLGIAEEGLGNKQAAIEHYNEVLKYWGKADIQTEEIKDTKKRLSILTS